KIGFKGTILIQPKPQEPTKHQYDYDVGTIYGFLKNFGLEKEVKVNIEQNHAILAGHTFEHEIAMAAALGVFGSLDINRGDYQSGWDTDQFAMNVPEITLAMIEVLRAGGFTTGGMNFDAKIRRQSLDPEDLIYAHIGSMDAIARGLLNAAAIIEDGGYDKARDGRYAGWADPKNAAMLADGATLDGIAARVASENINPEPRSGRQEFIENMLNRFM
ncbi:MAG: xylose isomerase, partial [Rhodobiaceae bacterium]|nr:xylose isomerase [Rhodobiaceae bacterium]